MTHICVSKLTIIGSDNGLSPGQRQAIIWTNAEILLFWTLGTNFSEILIKIHTFSFKKMRLKMSSGKWQPFCFGLNVLMLMWCYCQWHHINVNAFQMIDNWTICFSFCWLTIKKHGCMTLLTISWGIYMYLCPMKSPYKVVDGVYTQVC